MMLVVIRNYFSILAPLTLILCVGCVAGPPPKPTNEVQLRVSELVRKLVHGEITKIEISQIPRDIDTNAAVTPLQLRKESTYKLILHDGRFHLPRGFVEALDSEVIHPSNIRREVRWGVDFYNLEGVHTGGLYLNSWGKFGFVDEIPVTVDGNFLAWLEQQFGDCFK